MKCNGDFYRNLLESLYEGVYFVDLNRRITYWNKGAEKMTGYSPSDVMGRCCRDNVLMHVDNDGNLLCSNGLCPALRTIEDGETRELEVCVHHKDGHRVPVTTRITPFRDENGKIIGAIELFNNNSTLLAARQKIKQLQKIALLDPLTNLGNRRYAEMNINSKLSELERYGWAFGILFCDIDYFKQINDNYGHDTGDEVLRMVAKTLVGNVRTSDTVSRWGGDEFVIVLSNLSNGSLESVTEKLRFLVEQSSLTLNSHKISVTNSFGATLATPEDSLESLLKRVDTLMYESKNNGRNHVSCG